MRLFKGILSGALNAYSDKFLAQEIEFLINAFAGNEYNNTVLEKVTKEYMNNITCVKENEDIDTIKNELISKTTMGTKIWTKIKEKKLKIWHKKHFYFRM